MFDSQGSTERYTGYLEFRKTVVKVPFQLHRFLPLWSITHLFKVGIYQVSICFLF